MEAHVTAQSQTYRFEQRAREANLRHGQEVRADVPNVRVAPSPDSVPAFSGRLQGLRHGDPTVAALSGAVYFCETGPLRIREVVVEGDDAPLPSSVVVEGLSVPTPGRYDLVNVLVRTNGDLRLVIDEETRLEPAGAANIPLF